LGIVPAVISPFVLAKTGAGPARELFLTGERFSAAHAKRIGLVHHVAADETALDQIVSERAAAFLQSAPGAQAAAKALVRELTGGDRQALRQRTTELIANRRASDEGREGMSAFLEKRLPSWRNDG
jgi:methylglutaconyl-CoA hydratase